MGRDAGGHAHGNARTAVQQEKGQLRRQHGRFLLGPIEVRSEINGVVADFLQQCLVSNRCQACFGVAHGCRRIIVDGSEVSVTIQQWVATGEGLNKSDQGVVNRLIAVGMVFTEDIPDDAGAFAVWPVWGEPQFLHRVEDPALHRFQAVAGIGQGPSHDHAHGVFEVGALHLLMQSN